MHSRGSAAASSLSQRTYSGKETKEVSPGALLVKPALAVLIGRPLKVQRVQAFRDFRIIKMRLPQPGAGRSTGRGKDLTRDTLPSIPGSEAPSC